MLTEGKFIVNSKSKTLFKNLGILTISNFSSKLLVFFLVPMYTSVLSTAEYGIYDLIITTISVLAPVITLNITDAVMRYTMDNEINQGEVALIGLKIISRSIVIVGIALLMLSHLKEWNNYKEFMFLFFLYYFFYIFYQYFIQLAKGMNKVKEMGIAGVLGTAIMISMNVLMLIVFKQGLEGFIVTNVLAQAIPTLYLCLGIKYWNILCGAKLNKCLKREMLLYCLPLIASVIGWWINSGFDRYVVALFCGVSANGILSVAYKIPSILNTLQSIFVKAWQISAIKEYGENSTAKFYGDTFYALNVIVCAACSWLIILSEPLAYLLYLKDFFLACKLVPFLLLSSVFNCASGFLGPILAAKKDSKSMALSAIYGSIANIILNVILVVIIGLQGVTIATVFSSFIIYYVRKKAVGIDIKIEKYNIMKMTWLLLFVQTIIEIYTSFWFMEIPLMIIMLVINFKCLIYVYDIVKKIIFRRIKCEDNGICSN